MTLRRVRLRRHDRDTIDDWVRGRMSLEGVADMASNVQYITDANGERTAVILPLDEYQELLEDMHLIRVAEETKDEPRIPWEQVKAELADQGKLDAAE